MKRSFAAAAALTMLALPAGAGAQPSSADRTNAAQECRAERGNTDATQQAFRARYGPNRNGRNVFGKCVSQRSKVEERQREGAKSNASKECKAERQELGQEAFGEKYGTNANKRNAFGKCVSAKAREGKDEADRRDAEKSEKRRNAAKECAAERDSLGREAFAGKYGTNRNKRNAFGKCVSKGAQAA
ncbi:MAG: hypothetical protein AABM31_07105 [Actinomycetota bacterium]